ncbi:hypothetical protein ACOI9Y_37030, partial [Mesorhizobium japonicum]
VTISRTIIKPPGFRAASQAQSAANLPPLPRAGVAAPLPTGMYDAKGELNSGAMREVLEGVKKALKAMAPKEHKVVQLIDKALQS